MDSRGPKVFNIHNSGWKYQRDLLWGKKDSKFCNFWEAEEDCKRIAETSLSCSVCLWQVLHLSPLPSRPQIFLTLFSVGINFGTAGFLSFRMYWWNVDLEFFMWLQHANCEAQGLSEGQIQICPMEWQCPSHLPLPLAPRSLVDHFSPFSCQICPEIHL